MDVKDFDQEKANKITTDFAEIVGAHDAGPSESIYAAVKFLAACIAGGVKKDGIDILIDDAIPTMLHAYVRKLTGGSFSDDASRQKLERVLQKMEAYR